MDVQKTLSRPSTDIALLEKFWRILSYVTDDAGVKLFVTESFIKSREMFENLVTKSNSVISKIFQQLVVPELPLYSVQQDVKKIDSWFNIASVTFSSKQ